MYELLDKIDSPADIRKLSVGQLQVLCAEIRDDIIHCCAEHPGHLASSLGAVELIVGLHYVFDTPTDKLVFDVGHQAYAHKIITGRREEFSTLRSEGGISGFPRMDESPYDCFGVGHSSTSISAALGLAEAARLQGLSRRVVAVIGDGAMTGGLAFEGLNNTGGSHADLLVILNDNNQSIDNNTGALHEYLLKISTSNSYNNFKRRIWDLLGEGRLRDFIQRWVRSLKSWFVKKTGGDLFEALGFRYFGPVDGNDIAEVVKILSKLKDLHGPRLLHCMTVKGKGYACAEKDPVTWHSPGKFDPATGRILPASHPNDRYQDVFGEVLTELAGQNPEIVGITPAMSRGCGMYKFAEAFPDRFFDVGIEEEHAVTFAAGLAAGGMKPFCNIYSSFSQRAYDQIVHDVALQGLPVLLCFDRAGLVGEDGATHHGLFDISAYRSIPGVTISSPKDELELKNLMYTASLAETGPFIIRYPRGMGEGKAWREAPFCALPVGKAECLLEGSDVALIAAGPEANRALEAAKAFPGRVGVYNFRFIKPLDTDMLDTIAAHFRHIITVEDAAVKGGLYGAVCEHLAPLESAPSIEGIGVPDRFIRHAKQSRQIEMCGLDAKGIEKRLQKVFEDWK